MHLNLPNIAELRSAGLSDDSIAVELNRRGLTATNQTPWDAQCVTGVIKRSEQMRASDLIHLGGHSTSPRRSEQARFSEAGDRPE
jgi:hypothetical protein